MSLMDKVLASLVGFGFLSRSEVRNPRFRRMMIVCVSPSLSPSLTSTDNFRFLASAAPSTTRTPINNSGHYDRNLLSSHKGVVDSFSYEEITKILLGTTPCPTERNPGTPCLWTKAKPRKTSDIAQANWRRKVPKFSMRKLENLIFVALKQHTGNHVSPLSQ